MKNRYSKVPKEGYAPIYANNSYTNVNLEHTVNSMKNFQGFCVCNNLPSGRFAKLQGGYYILNNENRWERVSRTLRCISFKEILKILSQLK